MIGVVGKVVLKSCPHAFLIIFSDSWVQLPHKHLVLMSSMLFARFFCTKVFLVAFSSYILPLAKNLYEKRARKMLMKLTAGG